MGTKLSLNRIYTQIEGCGFSCAVEAARTEFRRGEAFQALMLRYVQAQLVQAAQSAACNAKHNMEQRLARWLLLCRDRAHTETFKLSQEFLADMLGSTRPTVSIAAGTLKEEGLIDYNRGVIRILDAKAARREGMRVLPRHQELPRQLRGLRHYASLHSRPEEFECMNQPDRLSLSSSQNGCLRASWCTSKGACPSSFRPVSI